MNLKKKQRREEKAIKRKQDLSGTGTFVFQNNTCGSFVLPRPTNLNVRHIEKGGQFIGDSYYFSLVKSGELLFIKEVNTPDKENLFVYQNITRDDIPLPVPTTFGQTVVGPGGEFVGGNAFFPLLKEGKLKLLKEHFVESKLITEQPPTVTTQGTVEFIVNSDNLIEEEIDGKKKKKLNEEPLEGVKLLLENA